MLDLVRQVIDAQTPTRPLENQDIEFIMAALLSCTIASVGTITSFSAHQQSLAADGAWDQLLSSVVDFIDRLGGAANLLRDSPRDKMSPLRFCCEQLAIRDVFGCFSTELPPRILDTAFKPWFFEAEAWSQSDDEWESVERMFGKPNLGPWPDSRYLAGYDRCHGSCLCTHSKSAEHRPNLTGRIRRHPVMGDFVARRSQPSTT